MQFWMLSDGRERLNITRPFTEFEMTRRSTEGLFIANVPSVTFTWPQVFSVSSVLGWMTAVLHRDVPNR